MDSKFAFSCVRRGTQRKLTAYLPYRNIFYFLFSFVFLINITAACQSQYSSSPKQPTQVDKTSLINATPLLPIQSKVPLSPTPVIIRQNINEPSSLEQKKDWLHYTNINYGFTFSYPSYWKMLEQEQKEPHYIKFMIDEFVLIIGYKWSHEDVSISGGATLPGSLQTYGYTLLFNQPTPKILLVSEGKVKSIYYNGINAEIPIQSSPGGLILSIRLVPSSGSDYSLIDIAEKYQKEIDDVVTSFSFSEIKATQPIAQLTLVPLTQNQNHQRIKVLSHGFSFFVPFDWQVEQQPNLIKIKQGSLALLIGYRFEDENVNLGPERLPAGEIVSQGVITVFRENVNREVLTQNNKHKAVIYNGIQGIDVFQPLEGKKIHFVILLYDFQADYANVNISQEKQMIVDAIVSSLHLIDDANKSYNESPTSVVTPTLFALSMGAPSWKDDFNHQGENWFLLKTENTTFSLRTGLLVMKANKPQTIEEWGVANISPLSNFYLEGNFINGDACSGLDRYGLLFRAPDPSRGYVINFSCDGQYRLYLWDGVNYIPLIPWTKSTEIIQGKNQKNTIGILAVGSKIEIYANRKLLSTITNETFSTGVVGLLIGAANTEGYVVYVDDVSIWNK